MLRRSDYWYELPEDRIAQVPADRRDGTQGGENWRQRIYAELRGADAVVCLVSPAYLDSRWCTIEIAVAQSRGAKVIPLSLRPGARHPGPDPLGVPGGLRPTAGRLADPARRPRPRGGSSRLSRIGLPGGRSAPMFPGRPGW